MPAVVAIAVLAFLAWWLWGPEPSFTFGLIAAVSVSGPIDRMGRRPGARWAADLLAAADALTRRL
mgnify:CR=1 FL=1